MCWIILLQLNCNHFYQKSPHPTTFSNAVECREIAVKPTFNLVRLPGLEPGTLGLEGRCSIRLSYRRKSNTPLYIVYGALVPKAHNVSGWPDSNRRPPAPKAGALAGLRHTP